MRNLKRALSLALASVMLLGMMVVGTGAAGYADVTSENNQEAIEVLQAISVMSGDDKGNFNPDAAVNREQMAVIMCKLLDYTVSTYKGTTNFTDVSAWALPYVEACYTNGIIAGYNDTQFGGNDPVTTAQAALMIMKALGYFREAGDFSADWVVSTIRVGSQIQLFDGVSNGANEALTRNDVAQLVLNALQAECVEIVSHDLVSDGNGGFTTKAVYEGRPAVSAWDKIIDCDTGSGLQLGEELFEGNLTLTAVDDDFGRPSSEWKYNSETIGVYPTNVDLMATYTAGVSRGTLYDLVGATVAKKIVAGGADAPDLTVYLNGIEQTGLNAANYFTKNGSKNIDNSGNGVLTQVYMDEDDNVTIVHVNTYLVKATADYNATKESLSIETVDIDSASVPALPATIDNDDVNVENFKEGDYILVTYSEDSNEIKSAQAAELLTGNVSEYTVTENVVIDGTTYKYNALVGNDVKGVEYTINEDAVVVMDAYGYIIYVDQAVATSSYIYIRETATKSSLGTSAIAEAYFTDGTSAEITISKVYACDGTTYTTAGLLADGTDGYDADGAGSDPGEENVHGWYTYTVNADGSYILTSLNRDAASVADGQTRYINSPASNSSTAQTFIDNSKVNFIVGNTSVKGDEDTLFVLRDADGEVYTYTGVTNVPTIVVPATGALAKGAVVNYALDKNGYATYVFIDVTDDAILVEDVTDIADYMFLLEQLDNNKTVVEGSTYYKYKVILDGEVTEKYLADQMLANGGNAKGDLYTNVKENSLGYITNGSPVTTDGNKKFELSLTEAGQDTITQSGKSLSVDYTNDNNALVSTPDPANFIISSDTDINLIIGKGVTELLKNPDADYETYLHISANTLAGMLKNYYVSGTVYGVVNENGSEKATAIYVYVTGVTEVVADDASLIITAVKGMSVSSSAESGVNYEVTVPFAKNVNGVDRVTYTKSNSATSVTAVYAASVAGLSSGSSMNLDGNKINSAVDATIYVKLTATCGTDVKTYVIKVTGAAESDAVIASSNLSAATVNTSSGSEAVTYKVDGTVADLYSVLTVSGGNEGDYIAVYNSWGTKLATTDTTALSATLKVRLYTDVVGGYVEYDVADGTI